MERKLRFLETEIKKDELPIYDPEDNPDAPKPREMIDLEVKFCVLHYILFFNKNSKF
jgi:V-type H+-transporting ATPase subunit a